MGKLPRDNSTEVTQVFTPNRVVQVTAGVAWTPDIDDVAFCVSRDCSYQIDSGSSVDILQGSIRGIIQGNTYTFNTTQYIEVM